MAGKSNKAKNRGKPANANANNSSVVDVKPLESGLPSNDNASVVESTNADVNGTEDSSSPVTNGTTENATVESVAEDGNEDISNAAAKTSKGEPGPGEHRLYPVSVKTLSGEKLELQLSPGDSVMDIRQFLLDAPETCFFTCYDLILHDKDASIHHLEDYNEISEVADITISGCSLEMVAALYDDRSLRSHVHRARELLSLSSLHASLSTSLALPHESTQQKNADVKVQGSELEALGFMEDITGSLCNLVASEPTDIKCVESITYSSFNPPPRYRRLVGDLIYLDVVTLERNKYCVTGTKKGFYVNSSTGFILDPKQARHDFEETTLIGLLQKISSKFKKGFREIVERKASVHPFENVQSLLPPNSWLGVYPVPDHKRDPPRAEDTVTLSFGSELIGMQRDWNEELQSCREFPHTTLQERILRDRALYKVTCDFVDAAINGAMGVIDRCIPPINPTDPECFHMYVHNNIFFSYAVDADLGLLSKDHESVSELKGSKHHENTTPLATSSVKAFNNSSHGTSGETNACISDGVKTEADSLSNFNSSASADTSTTSEAQLADSEQATYASANNDLKGTKAYQEADVPGLYNLAMAIIDYRGYRVVAQSIIPGILQGDKSDSLLYGSVDNGKKICWNESFHSKVLEAANRLHLKEHTVLDGSGNAVKLAAPVECKGIIGSDDRHYILDLMRVTPRDANYTGRGSRFCVLRPELITSFCQAEAAEHSCSQSKTGQVPPPPDSQIASADVVASSENLETDFSSKTETAEHSCSQSKSGEVPAAPESQNTTADVVASSENLEANISSEAEDAERSCSQSKTGEVPAPPDSENTNADVVASSENLLTDFSSEEKSTKVHKEDGEGCASTAAEGCTLHKEILLNPNVFTEYKLAGNQEEIDADEATVRKAGSYLMDVVIPKFVQDLCSLEISPMDGQTLTDALHAHGINVRYLGKVAEMTKHLPHLWDLCTTEIIVRSTKHILKDTLRESQDYDLAPAISHFFNCFIGHVFPIGAKGSANNVQLKAQNKDKTSRQTSPKSGRGQLKGSKEMISATNQSAHMSLTSEGLWSCIKEFARFKYQFELPEDARSRVKKVSVIRNVCQKVGLSIASRKYDLEAASPFQTSDILDLRPVVKHSVPVCSEARDLIETGKARLAQGLLNEAYTLFTEAFSILQQVTGPMHREVANCCRYLAMVLYHAGDIPGAILQQHKELIINERCLGLDHPDTAHSYGNMALFYHGLAQTELALRHMSRTLLLLSLSSGPDHPDVAATFINIAMMYQDLGKMDTALRYLQEALKKNERLLGPEHIQTAVCYHALAIALNCMGAYKLSIQHEKKTYDILVRQLGEGDSRTKDSFDWLQKFKTRESQVNAQKQKGQAVNSATAQLLKALQASGAAVSLNRSSPSVNKSFNSAIIGEAASRGRGVDERAARAAAVVRKKAEAKGLLARPSAAPVQSLSSNELDIIDSAATPEAPPMASAQPNDSKKEAANGHTESGTKEANGSVDDLTPLGLGSGLASLDSKKQKTKS